MSYSTALLLESDANRDRDQHRDKIECLCNDKINRGSNTRGELRPTRPMNSAQYLMSSLLGKMVLLFFRRGTRMPGGAITSSRYAHQAMKAKD